MLVFAAGNVFLHLPFHMCAASGGYSRVVDIYTITTRTWSTAQLSAARLGLAATSVGNFALFAGGDGPNGNCVSVSLCKVFCIFFLLLCVYCLRH